MEAFRNWLTASPKVDVTIMSGGSFSMAKSDQCGSSAAHGYLGIDDKVVAEITTWIASLPQRKP